MEKACDESGIEQFLAMRRAEGLKIDPETAETAWDYAQDIDPYGLFGPDVERFSAASKRIGFGLRGLFAHEAST